MPSLIASSMCSWKEEKGVQSEKLPSVPFHIRVRQTIVKQSTCAQLFKLVVLFIIAIVHLYYARDFLAVFRDMEVFLTVARARAPTYNDVLKATFILDLLVDYKKNLWISVSAMCACLSASSFFLLLLREEAYKPFYVIIMRVVDAVVFLALPALLYARSLVVRALLAHSEEGLVEAARYAHPAGLMNRLHCSISPRENVPLCSEVIERAIFPLVLLEYLVVLCIITAAYVGLAYLIVYCIKHWFPHEEDQQTLHSLHHSLSFSLPPHSSSFSSTKSTRPLLHPYKHIPAYQLA